VNALSVDERVPASDQIASARIVEFPIPSAISCLSVAARHFDIHLSPEELVKEHGLANSEPDSHTLTALAAANGLELAALPCDRADAAHLQPALPAIIRLSNGNALLLLELTRAPDGFTAKLYDPAIGEAAPMIISWDRLIAASGEILLLKRSASAAEDDATIKFGIGRLVAEVRPC